MSSEGRRIYERPPSLVPAWLRAVQAAAKKPDANVQIPRLDTELWPAKVEPSQLARYRRVCGIAESPYMPATWPQVLAGSLHIHMLTDPAFPLPAAGIVHMRNQIVQQRRIGVDEPLHFACHLQGATRTSRGLEFELATQATVHGEPVWSSTMTILSRAVPGLEQAQTAASTGTHAQKTPLRSLILRVPEDTGRRYAAIAGDYNPIHLHSATARLFGFPRAVAHGMWTLARCLAECADDAPAGALTIDCHFRKPVLLPATVVLGVDRVGDGIAFAVNSKDGSKAHLHGTISPGASGL